MYSKFCLFLFILCLMTVGCASNRVIVERNLPALVDLNEGSIEIQTIEGDRTHSFQASIVQYLQENTSFKIIHFQTLNELIEGKVRGQANKQTYSQADYLVRGYIREVIERRVGMNGETQYLVTSRPFLQIIKTTTGEVVVSHQFIGTGISSMKPPGSFSPDDGYSDAVLSARRVALDKFVSIFQATKTWMEIDLYEFSEKRKFSEIRNLIEAAQYDSARSKAEEHRQSVLNEEKGKVTFCLAVIESLTGNFTRSKELLIEANELFPEGKVMEYLKRIELMKAEKVSLSR